MYFDVRLNQSINEALTEYLSLSHVILIVWSKITKLGYLIYFMKSFINQ